MQFSFFSKFLSATFPLALVACGGGGSDSQNSVATVAITELQLTDEQQYSLQGDWQLDGKQTEAFIVRSSEEWNQIWAQRKAFVTCSATAMPYNQAFCDSTSPPPIDFGRYSLVALLINSAFYFDTPTPREIVTQDNGKNLSVTYRYINPSSPTFFYTVTGRFFLVEKTSATLEVHSNLCSIAC